MSKIEIQSWEAVAAVAKYLKLSRSTVDYYVKTGRIRRKKHHGKVLLNWTDAVKLRKSLFAG